MQTLLALALVLLAVLYLGRRTWRTVRAARATGRAADGCGSSCGCGSGAAGHATRHR